MAFKFKLDSREKFNCPSCGEKNRFVRYVYNKKPYHFFEIEEVGLCDRTNSCGHHYTPYDYIRENPDYQPIHFDEDELLYEEVEDDTYDTVKINTQNFTVFNDRLFKYLSIYFDVERVKNVFKDYMVFSDRYGSTVFPQIDSDNKIRTGKIINYNKNGHRKKNFGVSWMHTKIEDFKLKQCLFGTHLIKKYPDKKIMIVESEKTAIIGALSEPQHLWLANGSKNNLAMHLFEPLEGRTIHFIPDLSTKNKDNESDYDYWVKKVDDIKFMRYFEEMKVSDRIEKIATNEDRVEQKDIGDFIMEHYENKLKEDQNIHDFLSSIDYHEYFENRSGKWYKRRDTKLRMCLDAFTVFLIIDQNCIEIVPHYNKLESAKSKILRVIENNS